MAAMNAIIAPMAKAIATRILLVLVIPIRHNDEVLQPPNPSREIHVRTTMERLTGETVNRGNGR